MSVTTEKPAEANFLLKSAVRFARPVACAVLVAVWVATELGGWLGAGIATVVAAAMIATWVLSGSRGDPARVGNALVRVPRILRLTIEAAFLAAGLLVSLWGGTGGAGNADRCARL